MGTFGLRAPRVREARYVPSWLEPRERAEQAPAAVREVYVQGVSTHKVDAPVKALGPDLGPAEDGASWHGSLRGPAARGPAGVQPMCSDAQQGLKGAIAAALQGAS